LLFFAIFDLLQSVYNVYAIEITTKSFLSDYFLICALSLYKSLSLFTFYKIRYNIDCFIMRCVLDKGESHMVVIIPAYQPDQKLHRLVLALHEQTNYDIVIVNDGSDADRQPLFDSLEPYAKIMTHKVNRGKGAALKTALTYIYEQYPADEGVITIDADGQHLPEDIIRVSEAWEQSPEKLVLGSRQFTGNTICVRIVDRGEGVRHADRTARVRRIPHTNDARDERRPL
jgi:cellulose synthase/poly-beta-1,6-N-acetylglucosamine synthase-like glycosyltransferase